MKFLIVVLIVVVVLVVVVRARKHFSREIERFKEIRRSRREDL